MTQNNQDIVDYISCLNIAPHRCSNVIDIEAKFLFEDNLWAEVSIQVMNTQTITLKDA